MDKITEGNVLPKFELTSTTGKTINEKDILGKNTLLFIYPKDGTKSCTLEAQEFSNCKKSFAALGIQVFGISGDSIASHKKFLNKYDLDLELLSDEDLSFIQLIGSWVEKSMYGKKYMGIERTTVLVSKEGKVLKIWRKVRVRDHVNQVLAFAKKICN